MYRWRRLPTDRAGFTLIELLIVIVIIAILARVVISYAMQAREAGFKARADSEFRNFAAALQEYLSQNNWQYPDDVDRNIPPGLEENLSSDHWPNAAWPGSVYDWDVWHLSGEDSIYQLSIRFCPQGGPIEECRFPQTEWAENFDINSAYFYCFEGPCRSHSNEDRDYPGYCMNCECKEMEECH